MKKYIALIIILALGIGYFMSRRTFRPETLVKEPITQEQLLKLPETWSQVADKDVSLKLEKKVDQGLKPQIVLQETQSAEASAPAKYTDTIIAGARSAIPSLKITDDKRNSSERLYTAFITGNYINRGQKINMIHRVYIKNQTVYVLSASFIGDLSAEINQIFDNIVKEKIFL